MRIGRCLSTIGRAGAALKPTLDAETKKNWDILLLITLVALALRVYISLTTELNAYRLQMEGYDRIAAGGFIGTTIAPLYPFIIRTTYAVFGQYNHVAIFVLQAIAGAMIVPVVFTVTARLHNRSAGFISAVLCAVYPGFLTYSVAPIIETWAILLVVCCMLVISSDSGGHRRAVWAAVIAALGILLKPFFVYLVPCLLIQLEKRLTFVLVMVMFLTPWAVRNSIVAGKPVPVYETAAYKFDFYKYYKVRDGWETLDKFYEHISNILSKNVSYENISGTDKETINAHYIKAYFYVFLLLGGLIGFIRYYSRRHRGVAALVFGFIASVILLSRFKMRYRALIEPFWIVYTSILLSGIGAVPKKFLTRVR